jgi:hypothetical protein
VEKALTNRDVDFFNHIKSHLDSKLQKRLAPNS